jgi:hypothetical protein
MLMPTCSILWLLWIFGWNNWNGMLVWGFSKSSSMFHLSTFNNNKRAFTRYVSPTTTTATQLWQQLQERPHDNDDTVTSDWHKQSEIVTIHTPWMTLLGEHWTDDTGKLLDYWRVQRADSAVIVTLQQEKNGIFRFLIPKQTFRPGIGIPTLDFPGGRIPAASKEPTERMAHQHAAVQSILRRELGIAESDCWESIQILNQPEDEGWAINSSFSNQRLFGFVVHVRPDVFVDPKYLYPKVYTTETVADLLSQLNCLQCRAVLLEWMQQERRH